MQALREQQIAWKIPLPPLDQKRHNQAGVNKCIVIHLTVKKTLPRFSWLFWGTYLVFIETA